MFGEHPLKTQFIKISDTKIHLLETPGGDVLYRRGDVEVLIKRGSDRFEVLPAAAEGYGVKFLMVRFKTAVAVPPGDEIEGYLSAPIDVIVRNGGLTIDRFTIGKEKYALYGEKTVGVITRYHVSGFYEKPPETIGAIKIILNNPTAEWRLVEKVVLPIRNSVMYYTEDRAYYPLLILRTKDMYEVNNTGNPPEEGLMITHEAEPLPNFLMRW